MAGFLKRLRTLIRWLRTGDCGYGCGAAEPYGFVPECGCPIHDIDKDTSRYQSPPTYPYGRESP